jgi:hypothetical protein
VALLTHSGRHGEVVHGTGLRIPILPVKHLFASSQFKLRIAGTHLPDAVIQHIPPHHTDMQFLFRSQKRSPPEAEVGPDARSCRHNPSQLPRSVGFGATVYNAGRSLPNASHSATRSWFRKIYKEPKSGLINNATSRDSPKFDLNTNSSATSLDTSDSKTATASRSQGSSWHKSTALNALKLVLQILSSATSTVGFLGVNLPFDSLLSITQLRQVTRPVQFSNPRKKYFYFSCRLRPRMHRVSVTWRIA